MLAEALLLVVLAGSLAAFLFQGYAIVMALGMPRLDPPDGGPGPGPWPRVSVVVAARDEELDLPATLDDLLAQDYPDLEIIVVDGGSTDGTRAVAAARAPRVTLLSEPPLPEGWVGKSWACDVGFRASHGEWVLFTDADMRYHPSTVRAVVAWAQTEGAALATLAPRFESVGFWEKVVLPFYAQMVLTYFRTPRVNRPNSRAAMANGQFTLVRRPEYEAVGGHRAVHTAVLEDVALAQRYRAAGLRMRVAWSPKLLTTRMYRDRHEMFEGLLKHAHGLRFSAARQTAFLAGLVGFFWLPLAVLPLGLTAGIPWLAAWGAVLYLALFGKHVALARGLQTPAVYGLLFPVAVGFYVALVLTSIGRGLRDRPLEWKGRAYVLEH